MKKNRKGFTLVELVIVIAVIAVLAAILIPTFSGIVERARVSKVQANVNSMNTALVTEATANGVDYYTPEGVRQFLQSKNFDTGDIPSGYSLWYDQATFNLKLIKDEEIFGADQTAALTGGATLLSDVTGSADQSLVDILPRRPEAITSDPNLLILASSSDNEDLMNAIGRIYDLGWESSAADIDAKLSGDEIKTVIGRKFGDENAEWVNTYISYFETKNTIYVGGEEDEEGRMITGRMITGETVAGGNNVRNNIVFSRIGSYTVSGFTAAVSDIKLECAFELPENATMISSGAFNGFTDDITLIFNSRINMAEVSDAILNAANLSIKTPNRGTEIVDNTRYESGVLVADRDYRVTYNQYYAVKNGGYTVSETVDGDDLRAWWEDGTAVADGTPLLAKYVVPSLEFLFDATRTGTDSSPKFNLDDVNSITVRETSYGDYRKIIAIATYWEDGILKGVRFDEGIGYLTNIYDYITPGDEYQPLPAEGAGTNLSGEVKIDIKLPQGAYGLSGLGLNQIGVTAYYRTKITYYKKETTDFGNEYYTVVGTEIGTEPMAQALQKPSGTAGAWTATVDASGEIGTRPEGATHYKVSVQLVRVEVSSGSEVRFVRFVRFYLFDDPQNP